jgi:hypothetical protein
MREYMYFSFRTHEDLYAYLDKYLDRPRIRLVSVVFDPTGPLYPITAWFERESE